MATRKGRFLVALLLGSAVALQFVAGSSAEGPTIETAEKGESFFWRPSTATVGLGGSVNFKNSSTSIPHGLKWTGGPGTPSCAGVPIDGEQTSWSGSCTFAQAGTYSFICPVHPTEMKGTITVSSTEVPPGGTPPPPPGSTESPLQGNPSQALKIAKRQRGGSVRGSVALTQASAGGKLEVILLANRTSLSAGSSATSRVGRIVRSPLSAGRVSFTVPTKPSARRALRSREKLPLTVQVVVVPPGRAALTLKRGVVLHA